jgi:broad specificity phosphatase PhoE
MILFIYIPFSKVGHLIGWILSPTRNMRNISRYKRHINPWNEEVPGEVEPWEEYYKRFKDQLEQLGPGGERR